MSDDALPVFNSNDLKAFAEKNPVQDVVSVKTGRFAVPIPKIDDGGGDLRLPNAKELKAIVKSGSVGTSITSATMEGFPQIVPTDGSQVVVINNISRRQALAMKAIYDDISARNSGEMDRAALLEFFAAATGISYDEKTNTVRAVPDNIGIHGDLFNMKLSTFKNRHTRAGSEVPLNEALDMMIGASYYEKKRDAYKAFAVSGGFIRESESGTRQTFPETAMVAIGSDGKVSAIHANDVTVSYENTDHTPLLSGDGKINLPTYPVGQVLLDKIGGPPRPRQFAVE